MAEVVAVASTLIGARSEKKQRQAQEQALDRQEAAQAKAQEETLAQQRSSQRKSQEARQQTPDLAGIMQSARTNKTGLGGTMLTGPSGIDPSALKLGKKSLLGE